MITSMMSMAVMSIMTVSMKFKNPVKLSMILLVFSIFIFMNMFLKSGQVWFPLLFFLIFMGGILMMFMILSSILPNEKNKKNKKLILNLFLIIIFFISMEMFLGVQESSKSVKSFLDSNSSLTYLIIMMLMYFMISIMMVSKEESSMRSTLC